MSAAYKTREEWLVAAAAELSLWLWDVDEGRKKLDVKTLALSVGWPKGRGGRGAKRIGECWPKDWAEDNRSHIFLSPGIAEPVTVLATLLHELVHAHVGTKEGHKGPFKTLAESVGLTGKMTATSPGPELSERLNKLSKKLGAYPHGILVEQVKKRPGSRLRLWECECGVKVRVASDDFHATCNDCEGPFQQQGPEEGA